MKDKRPLSIKVLIGLILLRMAFMILLVLLFYLAKDVAPTEKTFLGGFKAGLMNALDMDTVDMEYATGRLIGTLLFPFILCFLILAFVTNRNFWPSLIFSIFSLLFAMSQGLPIFSIVIFIMLLTNPTRNYLRRVELKPKEEVIDT